MDKKLTIINTGYGIEVKQLPLECPYCFQKQIPAMHVTFKREKGDYFIFCTCMNSNCKSAFIVLYDHLNRLFSKMKQASLKVIEFNVVIKELSQSFCKIYNQAFAAEQMGLDQVCGVGYRKALEFLIKDYLISLNPDKDDKIKNKFLGNCIKDDVSDTNIKNVAERAVWLGNDETHYVRKWNDKDVSHLKGLINLCLHWVEAEIKTKKILAEMPEGI